MPWLNSKRLAARAFLLTLPPMYFAYFSTKIPFPNLTLLPSSFKHHQFFQIPLDFAHLSHNITGSSSPHHSSCTKLQRNPSGRTSPILYYLVHRNHAVLLSSYLIRHHVHSKIYFMFRPRMQLLHCI